MNNHWLILTPIVALLAAVLAVLSIVAMACAAIIGGVVYCLLYAIGAMSVLLVSVYMWWYSLIMKMLNLHHG